MLRGSRKTTPGLGKTKHNEGKRVECQSRQSAKETPTVANVNSNHAISTRSVKQTKPLDLKLNKIKSKVVKVINQPQNSSDEQCDDPPASSNTHSFQFEEDGDVIQMEISDGGAAAAEYASEEDEVTQDSQSESDDSEINSDSEHEVGEIIEDSESEAQSYSMGKD